MKGLEWIRGLRPSEGILALVLLPVALRLCWVLAPVSQPAIDYYQFWVVGRAVAEAPPGNVYAPDARDAMARFGARLADGERSGKLQRAAELRPRIETFSTPALYALIAALAGGDYDADLFTFRLLTTAGAIAGVLLLAWLAGAPAALALSLVLGALFASEPLAADLRVGNVNGLQLLGVALYLAALRGRPARARLVLAGALLGALVLFKPTLGVIVPCVALAWLRTGRARGLGAQAAGLALAAAVLVSASSAFLGDALAWKHWLEALPGMASVSDVSVARGNYAPARLILDAGGGDWAAGLALAGLLALLGLVALGAGRLGTAPESARERLDLLVVGMASALTLACLGLAWQHYFLLALPLAIVLLVPEGTSGARRALSLALAGLGLLGVLGRPVQALSGSDDAWLLAVNYGTGVALLLAGGALRLWASPPRGASP